MTHESACAHAWEKIGDTTFSGRTWCHIADVLFCPHCERYAARNTMYLDFRAEDRLGVEEKQRAEAEERKEIIARHRAQRERRAL